MDKAKTLTQKQLRNMTEAGGRAYLAVVQHGWARRRNAFSAFKEARNNGAYFGDHPKAAVYNVPQDAWVDEMGTIRWKDGGENISLIGEIHFRA